MATVTAPAPRTVPGLLKRPAVCKLAVLALLTAVLAPLAEARWGGGAWPHALTVDVTAPLTRVSDWIIDNRDSHPLFLYVLGHLSNAVIVCVRAVYLFLLAAGWAGVTALAAAVAWCVAGARLAAGTAVALLPVALGYAAVQLVLATHVGVLQLRGLGRALPGRH